MAFTSITTGGPDGTLNMFVNNWANNGGSEAYNAQIRRNAQNDVHFRGTIKRTSGTVDTILTLSAVYRPTDLVVRNAIGYDGSEYYQALVMITSSGVVTITKMDGSDVDNNQPIYLDIFFSKD